MLVDNVVIEIFASLPITSKTLENYRGEYRRHLSKVIGGMRIAEVTPKDIRYAITGLPPQTKRLALMVARTIFREALRMDLIKSSPAVEIESPTIRIKPSPFMTWEQVKAGDFGAYNDQIRFLALHGLRWGEAVALTGAEIREGYVCIDKSIHGETKTHAGVRRIPYLGHFAPLPRTARPLRRALNPYGVTIHSLRKTYAYVLKSNGVHVTTASKLLGHSDPSVTLRIYTLVRDEEIEATGDLLRSALSLLRVDAA
ncbi:MAG TPA: tyrosine-type recombinase/integrase [Candidatus Nanopelagicaceae bacterium]|nr:tyrosine-type recombinase/integrase [Candidatus Nanopelagicaceae bacterium]